MRRISSRQWINLIVTVATIIMNGLANAVPFNGQTTGEISDRYRVFFVPAGYVFSIWGLIYVALIGFSIYQLLPSNRDSVPLKRISPWYVVSCLANATWILLWHFELLTLTVPVMLVLLLSLIMIYQRLGIGRSRACGVELWLSHIPFSIYLGWITVATVANVTTALYAQNWGGWGVAPTAWAVIMLAVASLITVAIINSRRDLAYTLVILWAFIGIAVQHAATALVSGAAGVLAAAILVIYLVVVLGARGQSETSL